MAQHHRAPASRPGTLDDVNPKPLKARLRSKADTRSSPRRGTSREDRRLFEWASTWLPIIGLVTLLVLAPFWLVRLAEWLITR